MAFSSKNGTWPFSIGTITGYSANPSAGTVPVAGAAVNETITFTKGLPRFSVTFSEVGLPKGTNWSVVFNGTSTEWSTTANIIFNSCLNGSYPYSVPAINRWLPNPASGDTTIAGSNVAQSITFTLGPQLYGVTFTASGLTTGKTWSVTLNGSTLQSSGVAILFQMPNGSFQFSVGQITGFKATPSSGKVNVTGASASVTITFSAAAILYAVTFTESGLPSGTSWSVIFANSTQSSTGSSLTFSEPNGTYLFTVLNPSGYSSSPSSGSIRVAGPGASKTIGFTTSSSNNNLLGGSTGIFLIILIVVVIAVVAIVVALLLSRRKRGGGSSHAAEAAAPGMIPWTEGAPPPATEEPGSPAPQGEEPSYPSGESTPPAGEEGPQPPAPGEAPPPPP